MRVAYSALVLRRGGRTQGLGVRDAVVARGRRRADVAVEEVAADRRRIARGCRPVTARAGRRHRKIGTLDAAAYGNAYRKVDRRADRERQIDLIADLGRALGRLVRHPLIGSTLWLMHQPALLAGLGKLHDFLDRGYAAFRKMEQVEDFLDPIVTRERKLMEALFAGDDGLLGVP